MGWRSLRERCWLCIFKVFRGLSYRVDLFTLLGSEKVTFQKEPIHEQGENLDCSSGGGRRRRRTQLCSLQFSSKSACDGCKNTRKECCCCCRDFATGNLAQRRTP